MEDFDDKERDRLIKAYRAFYERTIKDQKHSNLSKDELCAIGQKFFDELLDELFARYNVPSDEHDKYKIKIKEIIKKECLNTLWDVPYIFNGSTFIEKD